jgi:hypothetical protein
VLSRPVRGEAAPATATVEPAEDGPACRRASLWARWPDWAAPLATAWSLVYGALGLYWALGGPGFPFGAGHDPGSELSVLGGLRAETGAPAIAVLGLALGMLAALLTRAWGRGLVRGAVLGIAWMACVVLLLVVPDYRVLVAVAYAPLFLVGAPFGWPPVPFLRAVPWPVVNQVICVAGGVLWGAAALAYQRRTRGACAYCGRTTPPGAAAWTTPAAAARWGRWAVAVAVVVPVLYAITRYAWALGIPLGITEEFLRQGQAEGIWVAGAGLSTVAIAGPLLTLGLVQRWGEIFPRWMPLLGGKSVPPALAIVPATLIAAIVTSAGLMYLRLFLRIGIPAEGWATIGPELLWPIWGAALAAAALAYGYRRRGRCPRCGRL